MRKRLAAAALFWGVLAAATAVAEPVRTPRPAPDGGVEQGDPDYEVGEEMCAVPRPAFRGSAAVLR